MYCIVNVFVWSSPFSVTPGTVTGLAVFTVNVKRGDRGRRDREGHQDDEQRAHGS